MEVEKPTGRLRWIFKAVPFEGSDNISTKEKTLQQEVQNSWTGELYWIDVPTELTPNP